MKDKTIKSRANFKQAVFERDLHCRAFNNGEECKIVWPLEPHHIIPRRSEIDDVVENGLALCSYHHRMITDSKIKVKASWLSKDQIKFIKKRKWKEWHGVEWDK